MIRFSNLWSLRFLFCISAIFLFGGIDAAELPFPIGEELTYTISWNGIPVAYSTSTISMDQHDGREVLALRLQTRTYSFFNHIFKVEDFHESLIDPETLLPIQYTKNLSEGNYRCHEITRFDFKEKLAHYEHQVTGKKKHYFIEEDTRDLMSFMYFTRSSSLAPDSIIRYRVMADEKIYDLILNTADLDEIELPDYEEKVISLKMVPEALFDGLFVKEGKATVWVSRDARHLMTFAKIKVPFGRVRVTLRSVNGPGDDFWITKRLGKNDEK